MIRRFSKWTRQATAELHPEQIELKGFNRSLAEIEWLLLVLVLAYVVIPGVGVDLIPLSIACTAFAAFVIGFRYLNLFTAETRWKLAFETWAMIALTAFVIWHTGKADSALINLYLLPIVFSALTLGKVMTLLQVLLITVLYLHATHAVVDDQFLTYETFSTVLFNFAPFVLVAYLTSLLAADMSFARAFAQHLSETDELTGLPNMRAFNAALQREQARAARDGSGFTVMMIDADDLKAINDEFGHEVGNDMLRHMVSALRHGLRSSDMIARYGGDEFIALLPNTGPKEAEEAGERVRRAIANMAFDANGHRVRTTVSVGCAFYPDTAEEIPELLASADLAMYASKKSGRNRVTSSATPAAEQTATP